MSKWQTRLSNLEGLSDVDKLYVEGKLLALGDDGRAARFFKHNEPDKVTVRRLRALLPKAGLESEDWSNHWGTSATIKQVTGADAPYEQWGMEQLVAQPTSRAALHELTTS
ncbi:g8289 [Coccomyxa elongata]